MGSILINKSDPDHEIQWVLLPRDNLATLATLDDLHTKGILFTLGNCHWSRLTNTPTGRVCVWDVYSLEVGPSHRPLGPTPGGVSGLTTPLDKSPLASVQAALLTVDSKFPVVSMGSGSSSSKEQLILIESKSERGRAHTHIPWFTRWQLLKANSHRCIPFLL